MIGTGSKLTVRFENKVVNVTVVAVIPADVKPSKALILNTTGVSSPNSFYSATNFYRAIVRRDKEGTCFLIPICEDSKVFQVKEREVSNV